jgi:hypothetical protein
MTEKNAEGLDMYQSTPFNTSVDDNNGDDLRLEEEK